MQGITGIILVALVSLSAVKTEDKCMLLVKKAYRQFDQFNNMQNGKTALARIKVSTLLSSGEIINSNNIFINSDDKTLFKSEEMDVYRNEKYAVIIKHRFNSITLMNNRQKSLFGDHMGMVQDTLLSFATTNYCDTKTINNKEVRKINLKLNEGGIKIFHIKNIDYLIDEATNRLIKMKVNYNNYKGISSITYNFEKLDFDHSSDEISGQNFKKHFDTDFLETKYSNYKINDFRKNI